MSIAEITDIARKYNSPRVTLMLNECFAIKNVPKLLAPSVGQKHFCNIRLILRSRILNTVLHPGSANGTATHQHTLRTTTTAPEGQAASHGVSGGTNDRGLHPCFA